MFMHDDTAYSRVEKLTMRFSGIAQRLGLLLYSNMVKFESSAVSNIGMSCIAQPKLQFSIPDFISCDSTGKVSAYFLVVFCCVVANMSHRVEKAIEYETVDLIFRAKRAKNGSFGFKSHHRMWGVSVAHDNIVADLGKYIGCIKCDLAEIR